jgi:hypothetical protein
LANHTFYLFDPMTQPTARHIAFLLASLFALVPASAADTRAPSDEEVKSFHTYYRQQLPDNHGNQPTFSIARSGAADPWKVAAHVDSQPVRGLRALCRMQRIDFSHQGQWSMEPVARQFVWLDAKGCSKGPQPVALRYPMPDADVLGLLERQHALLKSARLLFGGNTACAKGRAYQYVLTSIEVGTSGSSSEVLAGLRFTSDRGTSATVWVRRSGLDYNAWNVSCQ